MPRGKKCRRICIVPKTRVFAPKGCSGQGLVLTLEELEALRLSDYEHKEQGEAAALMQVSRGTYQRILASARHQVARALLEERALTISGGNYQLSDGDCPCLKTCKSCRFHRQNSFREDNSMVVAIAQENGTVCGHFGKCASFALFTIEDGKITAQRDLDASAHGHDLLAGFLKENGADAVICGGMGQGAKETLDALGMTAMTGVTGDVRQVAEAYAAGTLVFSDNASCAGHGHHHGEGHSCSCGK